MAQFNSTLQPHSNDKEKKKGSVWIPILFFCLAIGGPVGIILAVIIGSFALIGHFAPKGLAEKPKPAPAKKRRREPQDPGRRTYQPPAPQEHIHGSITDHCRSKRLEQLETLKEAGLYTEEEYRAKKRQIIQETANEG